MRTVTYVEIDVPSFTPTSPESLQTFRFAIPTADLRNDIDCIPTIDAIAFTPQRISLGDNLGQRATLRITFRDHKHRFAAESFDAGTFWGKWRARYGNKLRGRALRIYRGTADQDLADMEIRYYVIDFVNGPLADASYVIEAKDPLKWADDDRAQAPAISNGVLGGSLNTSVTSLTLSPSGIGDSEYPASGYVCLGGKEVCSFTRVSDTLTIVRARLNTSAVAHDAGERVQLVLQYDGDDVADVIYDLLVNYANVPAEYIDLPTWQTETSNYMGGILYAANITEPTAVRKLINELIQQAVICIYWDDRFGQIRLKVIREISTVTNTFTDEHFIEGSFKVSEQPDKRLSQVWCFYTQRDPTDTGGNEENFKNVLADVDLAREYEYGGSMIRKMLCRWIQTESAATRYTSVQLSRFRDPPRAYSFDLVAGTAVSPALGYTLQWWGEQTTEGDAASIPVQITQVTVFADRVHVECEEMLVSGQVISTNVVFYYAGSGTIPRPASWNDANNTVHMIGAGGGGATGQTSHNVGAGGGGGGYSALVNYAMAATESYSVGTGGIGGNSVDEAGTAGGDTWFSAVGVGLAKGGSYGASYTGGQGGQAAAGVGDVKYSGGSGGGVPNTGTYTKGSGAGGGAAGPHGNGGNGSTRGSTVSGQSGGGGGGGADGGESPANSVAIGYSDGQYGGDNRFNFGGGSSAHPAGQEGGGGRGCNYSGASTGGVGGDGEQIWTQTIAPILSAGPGGGGGGGGSSSSTHGFSGGLYGGGGGGGHRDSYAGNGADGLLVLVWTTA